MEEEEWRTVVEVGDIILVKLFGSEAAEYLVLPDNRLLSVDFLSEEMDDYLPELIACFGVLEELWCADVIGSVNVSGKIELLCRLWGSLPVYTKSWRGLSVCWKEEPEKLRQVAREWWHSVSA